MKLYIIRHADPDYANHTITPPGHLEAQALAERLKAEGIGRIFCSPLPRAQHTMQYTADLLGLEADIQPWMAELSWHLPEAEVPSKKAAWNVDGELVRAAEPYPGLRDWHEAVPFLGRGFEERFAELQQHSDRFLASLGYEREGGKYRIVRPNRDKIAIFCHHGFGLTWLAHLLELPVPLMWTGFSTAPSSVTTLLMDERSDRWAVPRCLCLGDTSHLYHAGLPISRQGIVANYE